MRVILLDNEKITKISLPEEIDGVFLMTYKPVDSNVTKELNIEADNGKWVLKSNGSINVIKDNKILSSIVLENYMHIKVLLPGKNEVLDLYCLPNVEEESYKLTVNSSEISIGSGVSCGIVYLDETINDLHAGIYKQDDSWYIAIPENVNNCYAYLNDIRVLTRQKINIGDVIFINGLKIIWMEQFIQFNNPLNKVSINPNVLTNYIDQEYDNSKYEAVTEEDASIELYKSEDYFYHTPNLREYVVDEEIIIDPPPPKTTNEQGSFLSTFGATITMLASSFVSGLNLLNNINTGGNKIAIITGSIMFGTMLVGTLLIPKIANAFQKTRNKKKEKLRILKYTNYVNSKEETIKHIMAKQQGILRETNISINELINLINSGTRNIWNREVKDEDFLIIRMGMGNVPARIDIQAPEEHFTLEDDELLQIVYDLQNRTRVLEDVPVTFNFLNNRVSAIIDDVDYGFPFVNSVLLQIAALHSAQDLKMCFFINNEDCHENWDFAKFFPHCFSDDKTNRYFAETYDEMKILSTNLEAIYTERIQDTKVTDENEEMVEDSKTYRKYDTYYILITNDVMLSKNLPIFDMLLNAPENYGFSIIFIEKNMNKLPKRCNAFIALSQENGCVMEKDLNSQTTFTPEYDTFLNLRDIAGKLMNIPLMSTDTQSTLPTSISFLEMYKVSKIEQLNINNRWKINDPTISLASPIGVHTSGELFMFDLHEKASGPHGLIAGSTGSGKSEFIITFVLSMCVNFHPDEVQFVLIDYKGGGLAGAFENREKGLAIPHLAGTITNLDVAAMNRSLVSINSELKRREQAFMDARDVTGESTLDIYKYQRYYREGIVKDPISHLFIVADEFAELKAQQPEFMSELISTARVGRSLGVHLILATQKPSGVVNDQIWSNSKFAICLKVQTAGDSNEMIKRPDAASIKEAGRFYLRVGYDEYFDVGQSGYAGAKYIPSDRTIKTYDNSINFINNVGSITKSVEEFQKKEITEDHGDQLTNIVKFLCDWTKKENYQPKKLWLDPLPEEIFIGNLTKKYNFEPKPFEINPIIGEFDNPKKQSQGLLNLNINHGNTYIYGKMGSGKEELISTIIYSTCVTHSPEEINFYIVDMGAGTLRSYIKFPHVGDVCTIDDNDKIIDLMVLAEKEINARKDLTVDFGGSFESYNEMNPDKKLPLMCIIINNLDIFTENLPKIAELIVPLYRDGAKYGVTFIVSCIGINTLRSKVREYFNNHLSLILANKDDYFNTFSNYKRGLEPANYKGRGLIEMGKEVLEFQSASINIKSEINNTIKETSEKLNEKYKTVSLKQIPAIPKVVNVDYFIEEISSLDKIPLGFNCENKEKFYYDFAKNKVNLISGNNFENNLTFLNALMIELRKLEEHNYDIKVIDFSSYFDILTVGLTCYQNDFNNIFGKIIEGSTKLEKETIYIFTGIGKLKSNVDPKNMPFVNKFFENSVNNEKIHFIFVETYDELNTLKLEDWYTKIVKSEYGIWLGPDVGSQTIITFNNLSSDDRTINNPEYCFVSVNGKKHVIKQITVTQNEEDKL